MQLGFAWSDWILSIRRFGKPINITIIQINTPSIDAEEDEIEHFYASIQKEIDRTPKQDVLIIIGDWDVNIGNKAEPNIIEKSSPGARNQVGEWLRVLIDSLFISNTVHVPINQKRTSPNLRDTWALETFSLSVSSSPKRLSNESVYFLEDDMWSPSAVMICQQKQFFLVACIHSCILLQSSVTAKSEAFLGQVQATFLVPKPHPNP